MLDSRRGSTLRAAAIDGSSSVVESRVLGLGGSSSRINRRISRSAASFSRLRSSGVVPVSSSYSSTPSEYTSQRVSISMLSSWACSGLMYWMVPTTAPNPVNNVSSVSFCPIALATPKSMTLGTGFPS